MDIHSDQLNPLPLQTVQRDKLTNSTNSTSTPVKRGEIMVIHRQRAAETRASTEFVRFVPYVRFVQYVPFRGEY